MTTCYHDGKPSNHNVGECFPAKGLNTMTKHTQGEWKVQRWGDGKLSVDAGSHTVANLNDSGDETEHNAHLIAAAPQLLEALERIARRGIGPDGHGLANWPGYETATVAYELATIAKDAIALANMEVQS
jgi:hypothetical protein